MRLPIVPAWFPLRALALQGVMALCVLLFCLAPLWYVTWKLEADIKGLETRIQVQETLQPLMEGLNARREETRRLLGATKTLPTPDTLPLIVTSLQEMVSLSGMQSSHFVPRRNRRERTASVWTAPFPALPTISGALSSC
ncbi:MAG: hypothetical protein ACLR7Z_14430 [Bilophila wadsworthia]